MPNTRSIGAVVWDEGPVRGATAAAPRMYPAIDPVTGVWGWTLDPLEAGGIIDDNGAGILGVDDATLAGGAMVIRYAGILGVVV